MCVYVPAQKRKNIFFSFIRFARAQSTRLLTEKIRSTFLYYVYMYICMTIIVYPADGTHLLFKGNETDRNNKINRSPWG